MLLNKWELKFNQDKEFELFHDTFDLVEREDLTEFVPGFTLGVLHIYYERGLNPEKYKKILLTFAKKQLEKDKLEIEKLIKKLGKVK